VLSDPKQPGLSMNPPEDYFVSKMKELDIRATDTIFVYDKTGMNNAPRALWMFKNFGVDVAILNGTYIKWEAEKRAIETGDRPSAWRRVREVTHDANDYKFNLNNAKIRSFDEIQELNKNPKNSERLLDARPS